VTSVHAALGAEPAKIRVPCIDYAQRANFGGLALGKWQVGEEVPVVTIDSFNLGRCDFVKIDVEGMEREVLDGARATLKRCNPILYVENDRSENSAALIRLLLDEGYRLYWHLPHLFNPANYFGEANNVFGNIVSVNMLCIPPSAKVSLQNFREITSPEATWR
jgi:hypothetical protein